MSEAQIYPGRRLRLDCDGAPVAEEQVRFTCRPRRFKKRSGRVFVGGDFTVSRKGALLWQSGRWVADPGT